MDVRPELDRTYERVVQAVLDARTDLSRADRHSGPSIETVRDIRDGLQARVSTLLRDLSI